MINIETKINIGVIALATLIMICGSASYYCINYLSDVTGVTNIEGDNVIRLGRLVIIVCMVMSVITAIFIRIFTSEHLHGSLGRLINISTAVSDGDLTNQIKVLGQDQMGCLFGSIQAMQSKLVDIIYGIRAGANEVHLAAEQVSVGNTSLSQRTQEQASSLEEIASNMEQMTSTVKQNADNAQLANQLVIVAQEQAEQGGQVASQAAVAMKEVNVSSRQIEDITGVINDIAFQTNLLALNAAVEAARAGESGRGFAVVASEVRNLAERCKGAAKDIKNLIDNSVVKIEGSKNLVDKSGETLEEIILSVKKVNDIVGEIAKASQEQSEGISQVNTALLMMDDVTQQNASLVEEVAATSEAMGTQAEELSDLVAYFQLDKETEIIEFSGNNTVKLMHEENQYL